MSKLVMAEGLNLSGADLIALNSGTNSLEGMGIRDTHDLYGFLKEDNKYADANLFRPFKAENGKSYISLGNKLLEVENALLPRASWVDFDRMTVMTGKPVMSVINALEAAVRIGTTKGLGTTEYSYQRANGRRGVTVSADVDDLAQRDNISYEDVSTPIPVIHGDFSMSRRQALAGGAEVRTDNLMELSLEMAKQREQIAVNGAGAFRMNGKAIQGLMNHSSAQVVTHNGGAWNTATSANIKADVLEGIQTLLDSDYTTENLNIFFANNLFTKLNAFYEAEKDITIAQAIRQAVQDDFGEGVNNAVSLKRSYAIADNGVCMAALNRSNFALVQAQSITNIQWQTFGTMRDVYKQLVAEVLVVKERFDGKTGLIQFTA